ncbi:carboxylesterase/lipase family protein [Nocardioides massiliensis]|uniref:Carboxylic ester hydrolase n=1 Tax=Nocardioides massiliensis TaxID=1325935 RepID=A0ABT9NUL6_9ACTN|nr:carboxylesterase family protein [Nocardioides massiliensis]MDP9823996.1 para-nitrobenzyl esterase [Nocardioides massiliensis]
MEPVVQTRQGRVRGTVEDGVARYLGIPYAASPVGERRFAAPVPPDPWDGERAALEFGPTPPSPGYSPPYARILHQPSIPGDDWLTLNVWTPDNAAGLPVMVWIHGGAFTMGNSAAGMYDGSAFARDGVVLVTINYRLGVDGFGYLPDAPAPVNRGLLDQVAALEWVRDNIAAFGGDPDRVTIFGESAGAMSVVSLMAMPSARGLFAGAVAQSGAAQAAATPEDAARVTDEVARQLGVEPRATEIAAVGIKELNAAQNAAGNAVSAAPKEYGESIAAAQMAFVPVVDGEILPEHPLAAIRSGSAQQVPLLTGTTTEEYRFFLVPEGLVDEITDARLAKMAQARGVPDEIIAVYRANRPDATPADVAVALLSDAFFRLPALDLVDAHDGPAWVYEFAWQNPHLGLGAAHAMEIPFVFDTLRAPHAADLAGPQAPQTLADTMHAAWVRFARDGDPGWATYDVERPVMVFRETNSAVVEDPRGDERMAWR